MPKRAQKAETRINLALDEKSAGDFWSIQDMSLLSGPVAVVRRAITVLFDTFWLVNHRFEIVLRKNGQEWRWSPHLPQRIPDIVKNTGEPAP